MTDSNQHSTPAVRLTAWLDDVQLSARLGSPHYANPSELKADLRSLLEQVQSDARKVEAYDRARSRVKIEGNTRAEYVLRIESLEEQVQSLEREAEIQNDEAERLHEQLQITDKQRLKWERLAMDRGFALEGIQEQLEAHQKALAYWVDRADHFEERLPEEKQYVRARGVLTPEYKLGRSLSNPTTSSEAVGTPSPVDGLVSARPAPAASDPAKEQT